MKPNRIGSRILLIVVCLAFCLLPSAATTQTNHHEGVVTPTNLYDYEYWIGSQHSHVNQDGDDGYAGSTAAQAFTYAKNIPFLDYFIVTPHLHASRSGSATLWTEDTYDAMRAAATAATTSDFVALVGLEVGTISKGGHWNLFNAADLVGQDHIDGDWNDSDDYYDHTVGLAAAGETVAAQFNHPNNSDFGNRYDAAAAQYVGALAVSSGPAFSTVSDFSDSGGNDEAVWEHFLDMGWKLSPSADQDNHNATWGASSSEYTVLVSPAGTPLNAENVVLGIQQHRSYATEDANMRVGFTANGWSQGQVIGGPSSVAFVIWWDNPSGTLQNLNSAVSKTEATNDVIKNIWLYKNGFSSAVATYQPNSVAGTWMVTVTAVAGDYFIVKYQDSSSLSSSRTTDYAWAAPVWYIPASAETPITVPMARTVTLSGVTAGQPYDLAPLCGQVYFTNTGTTQNVTVTLAYTYPTAAMDGLPRHYHVEGDGSGFSARLTLCYSHSDLAKAQIALGNESQLHLYQYSDTTNVWEPHSTVDTILDRITAFNVTEWGVWCIGTDSNTPTASKMSGLRAESQALSILLCVLALVGIGSIHQIQKSKRYTHLIICLLILSIVTLIILPLTVKASGFKDLEWDAGYSKPICSQATEKAPGLEIGPSYNSFAVTGQTLIYKHILTNTGEITDTFILQFTNDKSWPVQLMESPHTTGTMMLPLQIGALMTSSFQLSVTVPLDATGITERIHITATSQLSREVQAVTVDTITAIARIYLPLVLRGYPPLPYQPQLDAIVGAADGSYILRWVERPTQRATLYTVEEAADENFVTVLRTVCNTSFQVCEINGRLPGQYYYRVRGQNMWGYGMWSNVQSAVVVAPTATATPTPTPTSTPTPRPTTASTNTPTPTATASPVTSGKIEIVSVFADGTGRTEPDEYVQIKNVDNRAIPLTNWTLSDSSNHAYTFPNYTMQPGQVCRIYTNETHSEWCGFSYGSGSAIWNNSGDCAYLRNNTGVQIDSYCY